MGHEENLTDIQKSLKTRFEDSKRVLSFNDFLEYAYQKPYKVCRNASHYLLDAIHHYGYSKKESTFGKLKHWKIFDQNFSQLRSPVIAQEQAQNDIVRVLTGFVRTGKSEKAIVLYGPNGSAKTSLIRALFGGLEDYSKQEGGILFHFTWVFPEESMGRGSLGIGNKAKIADTTQSFALVEPDKFASIIRSELHENPIFLIPKEEREKLFDHWLENATTDEERSQLQSIRQHFLTGALSHKNELIFDALLDDYKGDFEKVLRHVRVERLFLSQRFRRGVITVEPQFSVDAAIRQVTLDRSMANLPPALQSLNLFQVEGDLIDGNRGIIEYNDFLKRPVEQFKYLLGTTESSSVNLGSVLVFLDSVFLATTNDRQLEAFREHPEFYSFKARMELVRVPYLLRYMDEEKIYTELAEDVKGEKELLPHSTRVLALFAVLTRLKKPLTKKKLPILSRILEKMSPLEKAKLYNHGELPRGLNDEEKRELKNHLPELVQEHQNQPYYEGLLGASARELKVALHAAAQNESYKSLGPKAILHELKNLIQRPQDFDYLRQEAMGAYHDFPAMLETVFREWIEWVDDEVKACLELSAGEKFSEFISEYINQVLHQVRGEKLKNRVTGKSDEPDEKLLSEFEKKIGFSGDKKEFRQSLVTRLGAWKIENPEYAEKTLPMDDIFSDILEKIKREFHDKQINRIKGMGECILQHKSLSEINSDSQNSSAQLALKAFRGLQSRFGYGAKGAEEALIELVKTKYR